MADCAGIARVFIVHTIEAVRVVADAQSLGRRKIPIALDQEDFVVKIARIGRGKRTESGERALRIGVGGGRSAQNHGDRLAVALPVVVEEEKALVLLDGPADHTAELVVVIIPQRRADPVVLPAIGVQRSIAMELVTDAMQLVRA